VNGSCKHSSLLRYGNNYGSKRFYSTGPCSVTHFSIVTLSDILPSIVLPNAIMPLCAIMLSVILPSVAMLNVVLPLRQVSFIV
jgi:hypothetical protein